MIDFQDPAAAVLMPFDGAIAVKAFEGLQGFERARVINLND